MPIIVGVGVLMTLMSVVLLLVVLSNRDDGSNTSTVADSDITAPADSGDNGDTQSADTGDDASTDGDDDSTDQSEMTDTGDNAMLGSAMRVPFVESTYLVTVDVPAGWVCDCAGGTGNLETVESPRQRIDVEVIRDGMGAALADVLLGEIDDDETVTTQETRSANGRDVLFAVVTADDGDSDHHYYVADSAGNVILFKISDRDEPDTLQDTVLGIAGTVEAEGDTAATTFTTTLMSSSLTYNAATNQYRFADFLNSEYLHTVELPASWAMERNFMGVSMAVKDGSLDTSAVAFTYLQSFYYDDGDSLTDIAAKLNEGSSDVIESEGTTTINGREVYFYTAVSSFNDSDTVTYMTFDSDDDLVLLIIQPQVPDKASLHDDVLSMAGNIEVSETDYVSQLIQAGLIEGDVPNDGFEPVPQ